ncbi:5-formyltetrahydrofolate cyclo-ligase [Telmatospirillum sp.]|uniref:5-formyltetrahydrofolate cyclo-ligase n=1 Tax=Telmatospirillum sp. TaxID=2079197 RepID=UPI00284784C8|nr:5-formyltetrahydrofolate cyclo-ligase [Telmatospirillum sp.]MDR3436526.1 5-formyltetrahydrofolate cyclo-ligase [Telmatospirillum sp.]
MTGSNLSSDVSKTDLRRQARDIRRGAHRRLAGMAGAAIAERFLTLIPWRTRPVVAGYWPMADEVDVLPLMTALAGQGGALALPVVVRKDAPLAFRRWYPGMTLEAGPHGTRHPSSASPLLRPDLLLVPLLAFDRHGGRLGYGGGYYDRTMAGLRAEGGALAVGIAYAAQEMTALPIEPHDQRLDWIVTEDAAWETLP